MNSKSLDHLKERRNGLSRCFMRRRPPENGETYAQILDDYFMERFSVSLAGFKLDLISNPYAIIATGAYGRREVLPKPEVRILFIFKDTIPEGAVELIRDIVYPLWDLGYMVTHSTKTLKEAVAGASADYGTLLSLLDSRFICGVSPLYSRLMTAVREKIVYRKKREILSFLNDRDETRHRKFEDGECILEPDLFFSPGCLADINSVLQAAQVTWDTDSLEGLEKSGVLSKEEIGHVTATRDFLKDLIVFLQLSTGTNKGRLAVDLQISAARFFNYKNSGSEKAVDLFLTDLECRKETIRLIRKRVFAHLLPEKTIGSSTGENEVKTDVKWVVISKGQVKITSLSKLKKHPELVFSILSQSMETGFPISAETLDMMFRFHEIGPKGFFTDPQSLNLFENSFFGSPHESGSMEILAESGLLFAFIPELADLRYKKIFSYQPGHNLLKHGLLTLKQFKMLADSGTGFGSILSKEIRLQGMWAALFHMVWEEMVKTGKPNEEIHTALVRFGKNPFFVKKVVSLIELSRNTLRLLQGEDPWDTAAFSPVAQGLGSPGDLTVLYLVCLASLRAQASRCLADFKEADLKQAIITLAGLKDWLVPGHIEKESSENPTIQTSISNGTRPWPRIDLRKTDNMRTLKLGFPAEANALLPALCALRHSGIDLYDLRLFTVENGWKDLLIRVKAPRDSMFETKKWTGFEVHLNELVHGGSPLSDEKTDEGQDDTGQRNKEVVVSIRPESHKTVIITHSPQTTDRLFHIVEGLGRIGLSPFYIKKTCCERDYCLVVHAESQGMPDDARVREVICDAWTS